MKRINLYFDFEFTSLSPDAQLISLGIVSEEIETNVPVDEIREFDNGTLKLKNHKNLVENGFGMKEFITKSFYAEFSDFDINRCDDWVKENVVGKLMFNEKEVHTQLKDNTLEIKNITSEIISAIKGWLEQFQDYEIQFVCDCGTFDWYHLLQLIGEWEETIIHNAIVTRPDKSKYIDYSIRPINVKIGLPKLPSNISPVPEDLNDLILNKYLRKVNKNATVKEAFDVNRESLIYIIDTHKKLSDMYELDDNVYKLKNNKHNSLWDAKLIKDIYNNLV